MSLCPSISGVALRMRSIRALTLGSICWAEAGVAMSASVAATRSEVFFMGTGVGTALQRRNPAGNEAAMADLEETMRFDPDEGIANLDEHLDRLKQAAEAQGFK